MAPPHLAYLSQGMWLLRLMTWLEQSKQQVATNAVSSCQCLARGPESFGQASGIIIRITRVPAPPPPPPSETRGWLDLLWCVNGQKMKKREEKKWEACGIIFLLALLKIPPPSSSFGHPWVPFVLFFGLRTRFPIYHSRSIFQDFC